MRCLVVIVGTVSAIIDAGFLVPGILGSGFAVADVPGIGDLITRVAVGFSLNSHGVRTRFAKRPIDVSVCRVSLIDDVTGYQVELAGVRDWLNITKACGFEDENVTGPGDLNKFEVHVLISSRLGRLRIPTRPQE